jgi:SAM-dependent methyltransferase
MTATSTRTELDAAWADLPADQVRKLLVQSRSEGWRSALQQVDSQAPSFARRMRSSWLGNWHLLLTKPQDGLSLDVGCGFGTLVLGFARYYAGAFGLDYLAERLQYGKLRADEDQLRGSFARGDALDLPFRAGAFSLVTMNGVLEWAGLYRGGPSPDSQQFRMLSEVRRLLSPSGHVAVAIENRYALETLVGMRDTHTDLHLVPALPRAIANLYSRWRAKRPYRTYLYSRAGYRRLLTSVGFAQTRVFDLAASYNDYGFVLDPSDARSYRLLYRRGLVKGFVERAARARRLLATFGPRALGELSYAYLVVGGERISTVLDRDHAIWSAASALGVAPAAARFAVPSREAGVLHVVAHDGEQLTGYLTICAAGAPEPPPLPESVCPSSSWRALGARTVGAVRVSVHVAA